MNKVKKIAILLSIIMLIGSIFGSKTYAALDCNVNLSKPNDKVTYKEQFSVYVSIANLQTTKGIIAIGGVLSYDTNSLKLIDIEGENKWSDPMHNPTTGKFSSFKNKLSTSNENVIKITFEVNEKGKAGESAWVKIDNFEISDGDEEKSCGGSSVNIMIGELNNNNSGNDNQGENNQGGNNQNGDNSNGNSSNGSQENGSNNNQGSSTDKKPNTGSTINKTPDNSTNIKNEDTNNEDTSNDNNEENTIGEDNNIIEDNSIQNNMAENKISLKSMDGANKTHKSILYIAIIVSIIIIIVIGILLLKFWKMKHA